LEDFTYDTKSIHLIRKNLAPERSRFAAQRAAYTEKNFEKKKLKLTLQKKNFFFFENRHIRRGRTSAPSFRKKKLFI